MEGAGAVHPHPSPAVNKRTPGTDTITRPRYLRELNLPFQILRARSHVAFFSGCDCVFGGKFVAIFKICSHGAFLGECNSDLIFVCFAPDMVLKKPCAIVLPANIVLNPFSNAKIQFMTPEISN